MRQPRYLTRLLRSVPTRSGGCRPLAFGFAVLVLVAGSAALLTAMVVQLNAGATGYIIGESHWSKAQQDAVASLYRYAHAGDPAELERARKALRVPLADREARQALERDPADEAAARRGFIEGRNAPEDVGRLIWMYRHFSGAPYFRESVRIWREAEPDIDRLHALSVQMQAAWANGPPPAAVVEDFQHRLLRIDQRLRPMELAFSQSLRRGAQAMRWLLLVVAGSMFLVVAACAIRLMNWAMRRVRESEGVFSAAFHQANVGMLKMRPDGILLEVNDAACSIFGRSRESLLGRRFHGLLHPEDRRQLRGAGRGTAWQDLGARMQHRFRRGDRSTLWGRWTATTVNMAGDDARVFVVIEDVSEAQALASEIEYQASHDDLTGLINRREIERRLQAALDSARSTGARHSLCFIDLDQFKLVNDTCGHAAGDVLLRQLASNIASHLRSTDWLGRLGGDEFAILLRDTPLAGAERAAQKINDAVSAGGFAWGDRLFCPTCSIGVVEITADAPDIGWLLRAADTACYLAKEEGRNRIRTYQESDAALIRRVDEMEWVGEIRRAIADERLLLYAQRIAPLNGDPTLHYEILVRLVDVHGRIYEPGAFLPAAERYDQASAIDRLVVAMALQQLSSHPRHVAQLGLCHINLSAQSIANPEFRHYVGTMLDQSGVPADKLCFEITETAAIGNLAEARAFIEAMRRRGALIALDDFGSGLSSFAYLKDLCVDILKIDGMFVRDMVEDRVDDALVNSISGVGRALSKPTIAEWAESEAVLARLREVGVDYAQGYAIHRPCPLAELIRDSEPADDPALAALATPA